MTVLSKTDVIFSNWDSGIALNFDSKILLSVKKGKKEPIFSGQVAIGSNPNRTRFFVRHFMLTLY